MSRKGARRQADISPEVLAQLNAGTLETATLVESFAMDLSSLLHRVAPEIPNTVLATIAAKRGITQRMAAIGHVLLHYRGAAEFALLASHRSDTVRGWAAYLLAAQPALTLEQRLQAIRPLADDPHSGVREWAWIALRPHIAHEIETAIDLLTPWVGEPSAFLRRFAVEITRPRGVWSAHIARLKQQPALGLPLLEPLKAEADRYVQDSVANWLNDAAKSCPKWVQELCDRWLTASQTKATQRLYRRALRSLAPIPSPTRSPKDSSHD